MRRPVALLALLACSTACSTTVLKENPITGGELTVENEIELTAQIHDQIRRQAKFISDPIVLDYIYELGQEIVATTEPQPFVFRFSLIDDDTLNAFTIGGGYVYLNSEVLAQAGDVGELVGVLAHEIGHVHERHIARRSEGQGLATLVTLASIAAVAFGGGDPALLAIGQGINVSLQLKNSRQHEAEADRAGIGFMVRSGYDPDGMGRFFQRILAASPQAGGEIPAYLYTHPALAERIADARVEIGRIHAPANLRHNDPRLAQIQARLSMISRKVAGGSGLFTRADFDRSKTDPLLEAAQRARDDGDPKSAAEILAQAGELGPNDPRVALAQAELAEELGDLEAARRHLEHAFELDPTVPLVQYRLGAVHQRLGNRSRAVFFLERAADGFRAGTAARKRAEFEIRRLSFPVLSSSALGNVADAKQIGRFVRGSSIVWWGDIRRVFMDQNPLFNVRWRDPSGQVVHEDDVRMSPVGSVSSRLDTSEGRPGRWRVEVRVGESLIEERSFDLLEAPSGS